MKWNIKGIKDRKFVIGVELSTYAISRKFNEKLLLKIFRKFAIKMKTDRYLEYELRLIAVKKIIKKI